ncbi:MAG TPA: hypothetical protein VIH68_03215 [Bacteroidota bacterium]
MNLIDILKDVGISDVLDIAFMSLLVYSVLVWFKKTRAAFVLVGMFIIGGAYLLAKVFNLYLTTVFQAFFAVILIAVIVIFQEEIKHFFEHVASLSLIRKLTFSFRVASPLRSFTRTT